MHNACKYMHIHIYIDVYVLTCANFRLHSIEGGEARGARSVGPRSLPELGGRREAHGRIHFAADQKLAEELPGKPRSAKQQATMVYTPNEPNTTGRWTIQQSGPKLMERSP